MAHILVADDDDLLGELVRFKLEAAGHDVTIRQDGASALEAARQGDVDLLVLDAMMPVMSGADVLRTVAEELPEIPVVMLTSRKAQADVMAALTSGARDYLTKPFIPDELVVRVNAILKSARMAR
ncbi:MULTISPECIES: response regulator [Sphingobium]|uniref:response regulator n=1 Tax=Sphingobium TaxID=165695 RepID=UPI00159BF5CD